MTPQKIFKIKKLELLRRKFYKANLMKLLKKLGISKKGLVDSTLGLEIVKT
jgi:hypothetical protein